MQENWKTIDATPGTLDEISLSKPEKQNARVSKNRYGNKSTSAHDFFLGKKKRDMSSEMKEYNMRSAFICTFSIMALARKKWRIKITRILFIERSILRIVPSIRKYKLNCDIIKNTDF